MNKQNCGRTVRAIYVEDPPNEAQDTFGEAAHATHKDTDNFLSRYDGSINTQI
jgi:hypothetical protein